MHNPQENMPSNADELQQSFQQAHEREEDAVTKAKDAVKNKVDHIPVPTPAAAVDHTEATVHELKSRLNWGEPALTILDVRDREAFDDYRILGAINAPMHSFPKNADYALQRKRDIYVYGSSDKESTTAAQMLRQDGFSRVAALKGGIKAWMEIGGSIDGSDTHIDPGPGAYNVISRLKEFAKVRAKERQMK